MTEPTLGNNIVTQIGIIVHDIESKARSWSEILGLPMPNIIITDTVDKTQAEYTGGRYAYRDAEAVTLKRALDMQAICEEYGVPLAAAALQFSMRDPRIVSTIIGMTRPERLKQTLDLAQHPIPEEMWERLNAVGNNTEDL